MRLPWSCSASRKTEVKPHRACAFLATAMLAIVACAQQSPWDAAARKSRAEAFVAARGERATVDAALALHPRAVTPFTAAWQPVGPVSVLSARFGKVSGRVTAIATDAADPTGNTVYVGTTGGGVWKSVNAAGPAAAVQFTPLTDTLPVFAANSGSGVLPSLSIGAMSVSPAPSGILLAGTGDPNDATDSYYGVGILRSADGGQTWTLAQGSNDGVNGSHSFTGLGSAGFAWSTVSPQLVVAAISSSAEGALVRATTVSSVRGLYYSNDAGVTWKMASIYDDASIVQQPLPLGASDAGNAATAVVWNPLRRKFYAAIRQHGFYESTDGATWTRMASQTGHRPDAGELPGPCIQHLPNLPWRAGGAAGHGRSLRTERRRTEQ